MLKTCEHKNSTLVEVELKHGHVLVELNLNCVSAILMALELAHEDIIGRKLRQPLIDSFRDIQIGLIHELEDRKKFPDSDFKVLESN